MRKMKTRILSLVLALALMFSMIPLGIFAEGEPAGDEPVSDGRGTGEYANAEGVLTYDSEEGGILNSTDTTKTFNILNKVSAAAPKVVFEFDFKWNSTGSTNDNVMWINFLNATGDRMHSEWDRGGFYAKNGTLSFVPINNYPDADADDRIDSAVATLDVSNWYNIRYEFTYTFNGDAVTGVNRQIFVNGESVANYAIGLAGLADLKIAKAELATAGGRAFNCDYDNVYFDVPGAPTEEPAPEPAPDNRGNGKYANAEGVLTYDSEANEVLNSTDTTKTFEIISPVSANATEVVLEFDFKWNSTGSADDNVMWINFLNANGDRMHSEWDRGGLYIKNGTLFLVPINNYGDSDADGNLDAAIATLDVSTWYNIRYEFTYTYTGEDITTVNRKISVNGVTVANYAIGLAGLDDLKIAKAEFATASGRAFNCDYDNLYFNAYTNPLTIPAPGEGLFAGAEATEKYEDQPKGFREAGGALTYDYDVEDGTLGQNDLFIYEFDFRWTDFGYSEQYDAEKGSYIMFYKTGNGVNDSSGRLCIKFKSADDDYAYLTTIGTTLVDADEDGIYDNAIAKFTRSEWYNIRFVVSEVTHNGTQFTPTIYVFVNGEMIDANGSGTGYGYCQYYDKAIADRDAWAPYHFSMSARSGLKFDIDNFYAGTSILGTKGNGEYAEAWGVVEEDISQGCDLEVTVGDSSESSVGEIFVFETDFALTTANLKNPGNNNNWVGYINFLDTNGSLMTTESGRIGICSDGERVVLCGNANSGTFELNDDGSVKGAYVEFGILEWHTIKIVVRFSLKDTVYERRVETYLDGELVEDAWDGTATSIPEFGSVKITARSMSFMADNVYLSAFETAATINGKPYESVDAAIAAANNGDTVKVLESIAEGDDYIVPDGKMVYLEVAGENDTTLVFAREMEGNTYVVVENTYFEFLGGSLRYEDAVDGSTNIRLGYRFTDAFDFATDMWAWEYTLGNNPAGNRMGENYNAENRNSNIVFTNVGVANYEKAITARLGIAVEIEGTDYVVFDVARTYTVLGVAEALVESDTATAESKEYAQSIIDAYAAYLESLEPQE